MRGMLWIWLEHKEAPSAALLAPALFFGIATPGRAEQGRQCKPVLDPNRANHAGIPVEPSVRSIALLQMRDVREHRREGVPKNEAYIIEEPRIPWRLDAVGAPRRVGVSGEW